jgi:hypothetical protein
VNPSVYPQLRTGGDFDRLVDLTRKFLEQAKGHPIRIEIQKMRSRLTLDETVDDFRKLFDLKRYKNARVIEKTCEALDVNEETDLHGKFYGCVQGAFFTWVIVFADGRVTHCCYDAHGDQVFGDLKMESLTDMIAGERFKRMYHAFERRDFSQLPRCGECFKHGGESQTFNDMLTKVQNLPGAAKDLVRKVIDVRYRG